MLYMTPDTWYVTYDTWHVTHDMWRMVGGEHSLKIPVPQLLWFEITVFEDSELKDESMN